MSQKVTVKHEILPLLLQIAHHVSQCACLRVLSLHLKTGNSNGELGLHSKSPFTLRQETHTGLK